MAGYWKCSNTNTHIDIHWFCRRHTSIQTTWHTIKSGTPEHGTPVEHRNTDGTPERWWNTGTLAEQRNTGGIIGIPQNSGSGEEQRNNGTAKQHQEILPIQNDDILSR